MTNLKKIKSKIYSISEIKKIVEKWEKNGEKIIFSNGCFDIIHLGHIEILAKSSISLCMFMRLGRMIRFLFKIMFLGFWFL